MPPGQRPQDAWKGNSAPAPGPVLRGPKPASSRRWLGMGLLLGALAGAIVGLFFYLWPDPEPVLLAIPIVQYSHPDWPPNPWAEADARGFRERFGGESAQAFQLQEKNRILTDLTRAAEDSRGKRRPLIVYVSALGAVVDGQVYLIPGDGQPDEPTGWITLAELLDPLRKTDARRLLILDVRPVASPRSVLPVEDVNESLDAALAKLGAAGDLPFLVLTANTPCDGPNVLRPLRRSVFAVALTQGISGSADGWNADRRPDGRVSVKELAAYVREVTAQVSAAAGLSPQVPRLHGKGDDFRLFLVPQDGPPPLPTLADAEPYPAWLLDGWKDRDNWREKDALHRRAPRVTNHLARVSLRAEQRWLGGLDAKAVQDQFTPDATELRNVAKTLPPIVPLARSVARVRGKPGVDDQKARDLLAPVFNKIIDPGPMKPDEKKSGGGLPEPIKGAIDAAHAAAKDMPPDAVAVALFDFAQTALENPTHPQMKAIAAVAAKFQLKHVEFRTVALIADLQESQVKRWPPGTTRKLLEVTRYAEEAVAIDGRCLPWLRVELDQADAIRRDALRDLCNSNSGDRDIAAAVAKLAPLPDQYRTIVATATALTTALVQHEETRAVLADLAVSFPHALVPVPKAVATGWTDLAENFHRLDELLRPGDEVRPLDLTTLDQMAQGVRARRESLWVLVRVPDDAGPKLLEQALLWPGWTHAQRLKLVERLEQANRTATERALGAWPTKPSGQDPAAPLPCSPRVAQDAARDLRRIVDLLVLVDGPDAAELRAKPPAPESREFTESARRARLAWRNKLPVAYRSAPLARQAVIGWAIDPNDVPAVPRPGIHYLPNPELPARRTAEEAFRNWLVNSRYQRDAEAMRSINVKAATDYATGLDLVAREYLEWSP